MLELWDAYDNQFNKLDNIVLVRGDEIPDGIYHLVCEIAVRHTDGQYLLMQRDKRKHFGGMWELTAGGSALKGELPLECAVRELREETGICSENLIEIGRVVHNKHHSIYVEYLCDIECDKDSILLQEGETIAYKWVDKEEIKNIHELLTRRMQVFIRTFARIHRGPDYREPWRPFPQRGAGATGPEGWRTAR